MNTSRSKPRTTFARTDITTPSAGLFKVMEKGKSRLEATRVVVQHSGYEVAYTTPWRLGADDWQVFVVLCALAGLDGKIINSQSDDQLQLWDKFVAGGAASKGDAMRIRTTAYAVTKELGKSKSGTAYKELSASLERLASVAQTIRKGNKVASGSQLISYAFDEDSGELGVGISHHMAKAILGESDQFVRISLTEMRCLDNQAAVLLQAIFSARIRPGASVKFHLDTLSGYIYGDGDIPPATARKRRQRVKEALLSLHEWTTWQISVSPNSVATVHRVSKSDLMKWEQEREIDLLAEMPKEGRARENGEFIDEIDD